MISKRDLQLGKIALKAGFVTKDQITRCLALKKKLAQEKGKNVALGALLIKKGYLTKEQLEEVVHLHDEQLDARGDAKASGDEAAKPKKKRSKKKRSARSGGDPSASASQAEVGGGSEDSPAAADPDGSSAGASPAPATAKKKRSGGQATSSGKSARTSARAEPQDAADPKRSRRSKGSTSTRASGKAPGESRSKSRSSARAPAEVDPAVLQSASEDFVDDDERRLIACPECGKKFRARVAQAGKRFNCRRCKHRIKVPKDLFERTSELAQPAVEVEEFLLGSGDMVTEDDDDGGGQSGRVTAAATRAASAVERVRAKPSIADLANAATKREVRPLAPKAKFGVKEAATMVVSAVLLAGMGFGGWYFLIDRPRQQAELAYQAKLDKEFNGWKTPMVAALTNARTALEGTDPNALRMAFDTLSAARKGRDDLAYTRDQAAAFEAKEDMDGLQRDLALRTGELLLEAGGFRAEDALRAFEEAARVAPDHLETKLVLARTRIRAGRGKEAAEGLAGADAQSALALVGAGWERIGAAKEAAAAYEALTEPAGQVLAARAWVLDQNPVKALSVLEKLQGLEGLDLAAARLVEATAQEAQGKHDEALRALDQAVAAAGDSPAPRIARAEYHLRRGQLKPALDDAQAANRLAGTPRGRLAQGDAHLAMLDLRRARTSYREADQSEPAAGHLVAGEVDALAESGAPEYAAIARCRLAALMAGEGDLDAAIAECDAALQKYPFSAYAHAARVQLLLSAGRGAESDPYLARAIDLTQKVGGQPNELLGSRVAAYVLLVFGEHRIDKGRQDEALAALALVPKLDSSLAAAAASLVGRAYQAQNQRSKAAFQLQETARLEGEDATLRAAADQLKSADEPALLLLEQGLSGLAALRPYSATTRLLRAQVRMRRSQQTEALADLARAIELNAELAAAYRIRGLLYLRDLPEGMQDTNQGGADIFRALELEAQQGRGLADTWFGKAIYHWKKADLKLAGEALERCLRADPEHAGAKALQAEVAKHVKR